MSHHVFAFHDEALTQPAANMRHSAAEGHAQGNIYAALGCEEFRGKCSGNGGIAAIATDFDSVYQSAGNKDTDKFVEALASYSRPKFWVLFV